MKDYLGDTLKKKEKVEEDRYFAEHDRELIEKLHRRQREAERENDGNSADKDPKQQP